jgi:hypothetical protein
VQSLTGAVKVGVDNALSLVRHLKQILAQAN